MGFVERLKTGWSAFLQNGTEPQFSYDYGPSYSMRPDRRRMMSSNERSIISSIYTQIALDVASVQIQHVRVDDNNRYLEEISSGLNNCLSVEANIDQAASAFKIDMALTLCDKGTIAIVPVETSTDPFQTDGYDIRSLRVGEIIEWMPQHVRVRVYNDKTGQREDLVLPKRIVAIVENPMSAIMNAPNSTLQRLIRKLNLLDAIDEQSGSGKLDLIIQLPYAVKNDTRKQQAEIRRKNLEDQLQGSKYGVAYTDSTEHITQLNRPTENNLMSQIEYLTKMLYSQLGINETVFDGTANEETMLNYNNRTIEPIVKAISEEMHRKFLSKTARSQKQRILYSRNPFSLVPVQQLAEIADKFTRNEILTSNEIRGIIGYHPVKDDPKADKLINSNLNQSTHEPPALPPTEESDVTEDSNEEGNNET